jgi:hypothetical protein
MGVRRRNRANGARPKIGEMLVARGLVTERDVHEALARQRATGRRLGETLFEIGAISSFDLARVLAERQNLPFVDLRDVDPDPDAIALISAGLARQYLVLPLRTEPGRLYVAMANPADVYALDDIRAMTDRAVEASMADPAQLLEAIVAAYGPTEDEEGPAASDAPVAELRPAAQPVRASRPPEAGRAHLDALLRRLDLAVVLTEEPARGAWSTAMAELLFDAYLLAFRNVALFLSEASAQSAPAFAPVWPPTDNVVAQAVARLRAQAAWLDRRLRSAPPHPPDVVVSEARLAEMRRDLGVVVEAFRDAIDHAGAEQPAAIPAAEHDPPAVAPEATRAPAAVPVPATAAPVGLQIFAELRNQ